MTSLVFDSLDECFNVVVVWVRKAAASELPLNPVRKWIAIITVMAFYMRTKGLEEISAEEAYAAVCDHEILAKVPKLHSALGSFETLEDDLKRKYRAPVSLDFLMPRVYGDDDPCASFP